MEGKDLTLEIAGKGIIIPQLAFGLYNVSREGCPNVVENAIRAGYRHFDCATSYENEKEFGMGLKSVLEQGEVKRSDLTIVSKVWKDAVRNGRDAVRCSIETSIQDLKCEYLDVAMVHWPVPDYHIEAYKELEVMVEEGKISSIGMSNCQPNDYEDLIASGIKIKPIVNQMQVSPVMYRPQIIDYFTSRNIIIEAHKSLHRGGCLDDAVITNVANKHSKSPAQIMIRWGVQKGFVVICKTSSTSRMVENRNVLDFCLDDDDMEQLDSLTTEEDILIRHEHEKASLGMY